MDVIDFFCGAGGFSEGFRQQGFKIIMGVDNWQPAVDTHNLNHGLNDEVIDILDFESCDIDKIESSFPDTEIIIGSPPCVTFSMSNRAGKADKAPGIRLIEAYLRIVAVKKHKKKSRLKAWLMENVPNSKGYVEEKYSFKNLNLSDFASTIEKRDSDIALEVKNSGDLFTASNYGSPQKRTRFICGEIIESGKFPSPTQTHGSKKQGLNPIVTLGQIKQKMPSPISTEVNATIADPNYPVLEIKASELTDHFYDTGIYEVEWAKAKFAKTNHPFMGKMSFPENENAPSRTIMATRSASTREAIIYKSEYNRKGDGQYRLPTIREASSLMGFPYTYQYVGSEGTKWRLIGNAVCPHMSAALAKSILLELDKEDQIVNKIEFPKIPTEEIENLNNREPKKFNNPPRRKKGARFRMHPFKNGNMTIALTNFDPNENDKSNNEEFSWYPIAFLGSGKNYEAIQINQPLYQEINAKVRKIMKIESFIDSFERNILVSIPDGKTLQRIYEKNINTMNSFFGPIKIIDEIRESIQSFISKIDYGSLKIDELPKEEIPLNQALSIWAMYQVAEKTRH